MPRPLSSRERTALDTLLRAEFDGSQELRLQAGSVLAEGDGLIIDLVVDAHLPAARVHNRAPVEASVHDGDDVGGLILFVEAGRLSALEYWWTSDQKPRQFPPASIQVEPSYLCYSRLYFEEKNSERYGWDLGFIQPFVSAGAFWWDLVTLPYHIGTRPCQCFDCSSGYCLPGDAVPYLAYPPEVSLTGAAAEVAWTAILFVAFP